MKGGRTRRGKGDRRELKGGKEQGAGGVGEEES
jgi:hypothetical protein